MLAHGLIQRVFKFLILAGIVGAASLISPDAQAQIRRLSAQSSCTFQEGLEANQRSAALKNSLMYSSQSTYFVNAQAGQTMTVTISSVKNNAIFNIVSPNSDTPLVQDSTRWSGTLPTSGDYEIIVGCIGGNATYQLNIAIR